MEKRTVSLIGESAYARLKNSAVAVFGIGGVGCYCIEALVRAGIGKIVVIDCDVFEESNLNRQLYATRATIGMEKAAVAAKRISEINPDCDAIAINMRVNGDNIGDILPGGVDYVCDAIDDIPAKVALARYCNHMGIPIVSCMGTGNRISGDNFRIMDVFKTGYDPLAKAMRKRLRDEGVSGLDVCISDEAPYISTSGAPASISYIPAAAGLKLAGHIIRRLAEIDVRGAAK